MQSSSAAHLVPVPIISSIAPLAAGKDAWLVDIWGVMHNGVSPFVAAVQACRAFRDTGGTVLLLSNAPRPAASVAAQLDRIGVPRDAWDVIVSSGDAARAFIAKRGAEPVLHLGPERDLPIYDGLGVSLVPVDEAGCVVCTGLFNDEVETADDYADILARCRSRALPMLCANPDITVERGGRIVYCAGALARAYEAMGGDVVYAGKPHLPVYEMAFAALEQRHGAAVPRERLLAIGDGARTDIDGAAAAGIASVYIASAVHLRAGAAFDAAAIDGLFPGPVRPVAAMTGLAW